MDPISLLSIPLFLGSLAVAYWAWRALSKIQSDSLVMPSDEAALTPMERMEQTIRSMELSHVDALRLLGERLSRIESSIVDLRAEHEKRLQILESSKNGQNQPANPSHFQPPPYV